MRHRTRRSFLVTAAPVVVLAPLVVTGQFVSQQVTAVTALSGSGDHFLSCRAGSLGRWFSEFLVHVEGSLLGRVILLRLPLWTLCLLCSGILLALVLVCCGVLWISVLVLFFLLDECPCLHGAVADLITGVPGMEGRVADDACDGVSWGSGKTKNSSTHVVLGSLPGMQHQEDGNSCVFQVQGRTFRMGHSWVG